MLFFLSGRWRQKPPQARRQSGVQITQLTPAHSWHFTIPRTSFPLANLVTLWWDEFWMRLLEWEYYEGKSRMRLVEWGYYEGKSRMRLLQWEYYEGKPHLPHHQSLLSANLQPSPLHQGLENPSKTANWQIGLQQEVQSSSKTPNNWQIRLLWQR